MLELGPRTHQRAHILIHSLQQSLAAFLHPALDQCQLQPVLLCGSRPTLVSGWRWVVEGATWWRNALGIVQKLWQQGELPEDGRHARCSLPPCRRFPLERHQSQMGLLSHVTGRWVKVRAEELGWSLTPGREGPCGLPPDKKPAQSGSRKGWSNSPPSPMAAPCWPNIL
jgi:hypothetical protein